MNADDIKKTLADHKKWLDSGGLKGKCADLHDADLRGVYLRYANLRYANLRNADLRNANLWNADLQGANLQCANLQNADLWSANLRCANLRGANLRCADLSRVDLSHACLWDADLWNADLDFSSIPLWCGSLDIKIDARIAAQLMYHTMRAIQSVVGDADVDAALANEGNIRLANRFHRVDECGKIEKRIVKGRAKKPRKRAKT